MAVTDLQNQTPGLYRCRFRVPCSIDLRALQENLYTRLTFGLNSAKDPLLRMLIQPVFSVSSQPDEPGCLAVAR